MFDYLFSTVFYEKTTSMPTYCFSCFEKIFQTNSCTCYRR